jgi:hypothetical protein
MAYINGGIPSIDSKNMKIGDFDWYNRKFSAYLARNKLHSEYNRKISAYTIWVGYFIKERLLGGTTSIHII